MSEVIFRQECYEIIGACMRVHSEMGSGFLEKVYQECLRIEFAAVGIPCREQSPIAIHYRNQQLESQYFADFLLFDSILLEIKSLKSLLAEHEAQLLNYLSATRLPLGLLVNFGSLGKLEYKRLAHSR
ncbi:MAG: GxxExxY protein [Verrucomicrobiota bacterium JB024]|nr:GxxExxY protein [Verrucomicrobiota bacterium JB024]